MSNALLVRRSESVGNLPRDRHSLIDRHRRTRDTIGEGVALDQLKNERVRLTAVFEPVDAADVRMVERGEHLCLPAEAGEALRLERECGGRSLSARRRD